jgi:hypothetical protein
MRARTKLALVGVLFAGAAVLSACTVPTSPSTSPKASTTATVETSAGASSSAATSAPATSSAAAPTQAEIEKAARAQVEGNRAGVKVASVTGIKIARDLKGRWWASARLVPDDRAKYDIAIICLVKEGSRWVMVDFGVDLVSPAIPAEVLGKLK